MAREIEARDGKVIIPRCTQEGIARRREQVWEYLMRGVPKTVMAELLNVSRKTIWEDVLYLRGRAGRETGAIKGDVDKTNQEVGIIAAKLATVADSAMSEYALSSGAPAKVRFLDTAVKAHWIRARVLMETGILPRAGEEVKVTSTTEVTFTQKFGDQSPLSTLDDPVSRRKVLAAVENVLRQAQASSEVVVEGKLIEARPGGAAGAAEGPVAGK